MKWLFWISERRRVPASAAKSPKADEVYLMKEQNDHLHKLDGENFGSLKKCMHDTTHQISRKEYLSLLRQPRKGERKGRVARGSEEKEDSGYPKKELNEHLRNGERDNLAALMKLLQKITLQILPKECLSLHKQPKNRELKGRVDSDSEEEEHGAHLTKVHNDHLHNGERENFAALMKWKQKKNTPDFA